jgi:6-pyruvoyl-tetrahydropterin synthase related domain
MKPIAAESFRKQASTYLAVLALAILAAWPLLTHGVVTSVDGPNHYYRLVELSWHFQHGDFYPRWFSDINYGLGGPLFNYYASLSYYVPLVLHFVGLSLPTAFLAAFILAVAIAAFGMFVWAKAQFHSSLAGLIASAVYVLSPYLYYNVLIRGALPEAWGLALAPWLLWSAYQAVVAPNKLRYTLLALFYAALILTHSLSALLFTPILILYLLALLGLPKRTNLKPWLWLGGALALAVGLSAFFLLPFFLENSYINLSRATLDYAGAFVSPADLFAWPIPFDPHLARNPYPLSLSLPAFLLAIAGLFLLWRVRRAHSISWVVAAFPAIFVIYAVCSLNISAPLWKFLPLGSLVQFPWRLLGPATLLLAWLVASTVTLINLRGFWPLAFCVLFFYTLTWTYIYPDTNGYPASGSPVDVVQYEISKPVAVGLTYQQEFTPVWVQQLPTPADALVRYTTNLVPSRLIQPPSDFTILSETNLITSTEIKYQSASNHTLDFALLYFPGWTATLDGHLIQAQPTSPQGHVSVYVPSGEHVLNVSLQPTSIQWIASLLSLLSLLFLGLFWLRPQSQGSTLPAPIASPNLSWVWTALLLGLLLLRIGVLDRFDTPFSHTQINNVPNPPAQPVLFADQLVLIGSDLTQAQTLAADQPLKVTLYWQALTNISTDYHVSIQLVDDLGNRFGQSDQYPGFVPTGGWQSGQYLPDSHTWTALEGTPPGTYHLKVSVYAIQDATASPLSAIIGDTPSGVEYDLGTISLTTGWLHHPGPLQILEAASAAQTLSVGDALPFSLAWQTGDAPPSGVQAEMRLSDTADKVLYSTRFNPAGDNYPSDQWQPNQLIRFPHSLILPPDLPAGPVQAAIIFLDPTGQPISNSFVLGNLTISAPQRSYTIPDISHRLDYDFGSGMRLLGYNSNSDALVLYWQTRQVTTTRYTVFVHEFDSTGAFVGGHDSAPVRATTSWLPGEVITDQRPPVTSNYFEIGLYDLVTGERLGAPLTINP